MPAISKAFCVVKKEILSWIGVTLGVCDSISQRNGVYDPIAVSRLRGRSRCGAAKAQLDHKKFPFASSVPGEPDFQRGDD